MSSRPLISGFIACVTLLGAWIWFEIHPTPSSEPVEEASEKTPDSALPVVASDRPDSLVESAGRARVRIARRKRISEAEAVFRPEWESWFNRMSPSDRDGRFQEKLGRTPEAKLIRFAFAVELNEFPTPLTPEEQAQIRSEMEQTFRHANATVFQGLQKIALETEPTEKGATELRIVRDLLSRSAVENSFAQMMIQDLFVREFYRDPTQSFPELAERYGVQKDHPLYERVQKAFDRAPAGR